MNVALVVLAYYGVAWLCKVEAGLTSRCHLGGHGKHRNFFGADKILPNDAMTGIGGGATSDFANAHVSCIQRAYNLDVHVILL